MATKGRGNEWKKIKIHLIMVTLWFIFLTKFAIVLVSYCYVMSPNLVALIQFIIIFHSSVS